MHLVYFKNCIHLLIGMRNFVNGLVNCPCFRWWSIVFKKVKRTRFKEVDLKESDNLAVPCLVCQAADQGSLVHVFTVHCNEWGYSDPRSFLLWQPR